MLNHCKRHYGMHFDDFAYRCKTNFTGIRGHLDEANKQQYVKHYLNDAENLYGVHSEFTGIPNFMVWNPDSTWLDQGFEPLSIDTIIGNTRRYVANMTEEELDLFLPVFQQLCVLYPIYRIAITNHTVEFHTTINGEPKRLLVSVMNMIDFDRDPNTMRHWWQRDTIN